jgi:hypothetical protein
LKPHHSFVYTLYKANTDGNNYLYCKAFTKGINISVEYSFDIV